MPTLKQRAVQDDANILFSVANDLAKVKQNLTLLNSPFGDEVILLLLPESFRDLLVLLLFNLTGGTKFKL